MTPPAPTPTVYTSRGRTYRRLAVAAVALALVLGGYGVVRAVTAGSPPATAAPAAAPAAVASAAPPAVPASAPSAPPATTPPATTPPATTPAVALAVPAPAGVPANLRIQAEAFTAQQGVDTQDAEDAGGTRNVGWANAGDWLRYDRIDFGAAPARRFVARVASDNDRGGVLRVHVDSPTGPPVAVLRVADTGGWQDWRTQAARVAPVTGVHTVFVTFAGDGDLVNVNWFRFAR